MPHLSPMSWITSLAMFWISVSLLFSTVWWSNNFMFKSTMSDKDSKSYSPWNWLLRDGRDLNIKL